MSTRKFHKTFSHLKPSTNSPINLSQNLKRILKEDKELLKRLAE